MIVFTLLRFTKAILIFSLFVFFAPLFILPFFNHASADDYICGIHLQSEGFLRYQSFIYQHWGGRFAATFTGSLFANHSFLYQHYYLHTLLLLLLDIVSAFFLLFVLNKYILKEARVKRFSGVVCLLFIALQYCSLIEPATYFFWFSSAVTYHLPFILLQFEIALWLLLFFTRTSSVKLVCSAFLFILIIFINGYNELFIIAQSFLLLFLFLECSYKKLSRSFIAFILTAFVASALFVFLAPGNSARSAEMVGKSWLTGAAVICFHIVEVLWSVGKNPIVWMACVAVYLFANQRQERLRNFSLLQLFANKRILLPAIIFCFLLAAIGLAVAGLKGGVLPDRYLNAVISIIVVLLLLLFFVEGIAAKNRMIATALLQKKWLIATACIIGLLANNFVKEEYKSLVSAPVYHAIMNERETTLQNARGNKMAEVKSYDTALKKIMTIEYSNTSKTISDLLRQKPSFLFFSDDLADEYAKEELAEFYGIKQIVVK